MRVVFVPVRCRDDRLLAVHGRATDRRQQQHGAVRLPRRLERTLAQVRRRKTYVEIAVHEAGAVLKWGWGHSSKLFGI